MSRVLNEILVVDATLYLFIRRGTITDDEFPVIGTSNQLATRSRQCQPAGVVGYTAEAIQGCAPDVSSLHITERVYLGLAAIEHSREPTDTRDMHVYHMVLVSPKLLTTLS